MINKVINTIIKNNMFNKGDRVVVAVSGGPDSICLLDLLYKLKSRFEIQICAAHVNHCLRGKEADEDERYVEDFCKELNIKFFCKKVDVNLIASEKKLSSEMAGREVRYNFFEEVKEKFNANKIAIAHNANDNAETMLMRIIRGTGLSGMVGIKAIRDGYFVRPLIEISRQEIEDYCIENRITPRIDKTNNERLYSRNKIRLDLIPYIKSNFNEDIISALNRLGDLIKVDDDYLQKKSYEKYNNYCCFDGKNIIINKDAFSEHEAILSRIIRKAVYDLNGSTYNLEKKHIDDIIYLQKIGTGKKLNLPNKIVISNNYGDICLHVKNEDIIKNESIYNVDIEEAGEIKYQDIKIKCELLYNKDEIKVKSDRYTKYFDADKTGKNMSIRCRREGDRFMPLGMKSYKKLKDIFINLKIPRDDRNNIPMVCFEDEIGWIIGYKVSEKFKIDDKTQKILKLKIEREDY
ncbi:tRNA lysidine(34) synthetase TilS [Clostridium hydrogenum]|uniref:tRNA lysidine(34) synthetase TilS n=1 Tax=Clostridium hydrogenum TaxID=2855764 RepID=UPI001F25FE80|nr:tRNA lysidine(34) synthetase TilS [Clostridium hydrogenum]